jgi:periplasmic protein TonB
MPIYQDNRSESDQCAPCPAFPRPKLRIDSQVTVLLEHKKEEDPESFPRQERDLFQDSLFVSGAKSRRRNPWAAIGSVTLLSLFLLALVVILLLHTDALPERETVTMLYLPPAAAASNTTSLPAPTFTSGNTPTKIKIRIRIPSLVHAAQEAPSPQLDTAGGLVGGVPGGVVGGIPEGVLSEMLRSTGRAPILAKTSPMPKRMRIASRVAAANLIHDVAPIYPPEAGRARIEGTVVLLAVIGKDGTVQDVRVEKGEPVLAQAAIDAVKQWRYRPYLLNGEPVEIDSQITINFNLSRG